MQWQAQEHFGNMFVRDVTRGIITRTSCVEAGRVGATIREGVEDRGLTRGNIREQRGRGNVTETTDCGAYVASAWANIHRAWVKEASLGKGVQAVRNPWDIAWRQGGSRGKSCDRTRNTSLLCATLPCSCAH